VPAVIKVCATVLNRPLPPHTMVRLEIGDSMLSLLITVHASEHCLVGLSRAHHRSSQDLNGPWITVALACRL
jgi:hypothetical protein